MEKIFSVRNEKFIFAEAFTSHALDLSTNFPLVVLGRGCIKVTCRLINKMQLFYKRNFHPFFFRWFLDEKTLKTFKTNEKKIINSFPVLSLIKAILFLHNFVWWSVFVASASFVPERISLCKILRISRWMQWFVFIKTSRVVVKLDYTTEAETRENR